MVVANHGRKSRSLSMFGAQKKRRLPLRITCAGEAAFLIVTCQRGILVLGRPGSDLLSQGLSHSTIGAEEFNGRVRDGIGCKLLARTTRPAKDKDTKQAVWRMVSRE